MALSTRLTAQIEAIARNRGITEETAALITRAEVLAFDGADDVTILRQTEKDALQIKASKTAFNTQAKKKAMIEKAFDTAYPKTVSGPEVAKLLVEPAKAPDIIRSAQPFFDAIQTLARLFRPILNTIEPNETPEKTAGAIQAVIDFYKPFRAAARADAVKLATFNRKFQIPARLPDKITNDSVCVELVFMPEQIATPTDAQRLQARLQALLDKWNVQHAKDTETTVEAVEEAQTAEAQANFNEMMALVELATNEPTYTSTRDGKTINVRRTRWDAATTTQMKAWVARGRTGLPQ